MQKRIFSLTLVILMSVKFSCAQILEPTALTSASNHSNLTTIDLTWIVGEWMTESYLGHTNIEQGFLHPIFHSVNQTTPTKNTRLEKVSLWPNPANTTFQINLINVPAEVFLFDNLGRLCQKWLQIKPTQQFSSSHLPNGQYYVLVKRNQAFKMYAPVTINH